MVLAVIVFFPMRPSGRENPSPSGPTIHAAPLIQDKSLQDKLERMYTHIQAYGSSEDQDRQRWNQAATQAITDYYRANLDVEPAQTSNGALTLWIESTADKWVESIYQDKQANQTDAPASTRTLLQKMAHMLEAVK